MTPTESSCSLAFNLRCKSWKSGRPEPSLDLAITAWLKPPDTRERLAIAHPTVGRCKALLILACSQLGSKGDLDASLDEQTVRRSTGHLGLHHARNDYDRVERHLVHLHQE